MQPSAEYRVLRTTDELNGFVPAWWRLWERDPHAIPFQSPAWLVPWWHQFGTKNLCSVVIQSGGEAIGFLPFYRYEDATKCQRQLLPLGVGTTDYLDGVFSPACSDEEISGALQLLLTEVEHDLFCAMQLPPNSKLFENLARASSSTGEPLPSGNLHISKSDGCSRMHAVPMAELPQKIRRNAMYYRNRARRSGSLNLTQADESNWQRIFADLQRLHTQRWQSRGEDGVLVDQRVLDWYRAAIPLLLEGGLLRLMSLELDKRVIAVLYSLIDPERDGRTQYFYITAYSPEFSDLRPGTLLIAYAVEQATTEGVAMIDMLRGDEEYKRIWHMEKRPTWCVSRFGSTGIRPE